MLHFHGFEDQEGVARGDCLAWLDQDMKDLAWHGGCEAASGVLGVGAGVARLLGQCAGRIEPLDMESVVGLIVDDAERASNAGVVLECNGIVVGNEVDWADADAVDREMECVVAQVAVVYLDGAFVDGKIDVLVGKRIVAKAGLEFGEMGSMGSAFLVTKQGGGDGGQIVCFVYFGVDGVGEKTGVVVQKVGGQRAGQISGVGQHACKKGSIGLDAVDRQGRSGS